MDTRWAIIAIIICAGVTGFAVGWVARDVVDENPPLVESTPAGPVLTEIEALTLFEDGWFDGVLGYIAYNNRTYGYSPQDWVLVENCAVAEFNPNRGAWVIECNTFVNNADGERVGGPDPDVYLLIDATSEIRYVDGSRPFWDFWEESEVETTAQEGG